MLLSVLKRFQILKSIKMAVLVQNLRRFSWLGVFCLLVELHREGSAPAAFAAGLFSSFLHVFTCSVGCVARYLNILGPKTPSQCSSKKLTLIILMYLEEATTKANKLMLWLWSINYKVCDLNKTWGKNEPLICTPDILRWRPLTLYV